MLAVEVRQHLVLVAQGAAVLAVQLAQMVLLVLLTRAAVAVLDIQLLMAQQAVQGLSSFPTLAHSVAQAARLHRLVETRSIHLQAVQHTTLNNLSCSGATFTSSAVV